MTLVSGAQLLQTTRLPASAQPGECLSQPVSILDQLEDQETWLLDHASSVRCLVTHSMRGAARDLLERLPNLGLIANFGAGLDLLDVDYARTRDIRVTATADVLADDVADLALWLVLTLLRGNASGDSFVRKGHWRAGAFPLGRGALGRRVGIMGLGRIGQAIADRVSVMGMDVAYFSRRDARSAPYRFEPDLLALAQWADLLIVALPGGGATSRMIDRSVLNAIGPDGFLVNVARGSIVDELALVAALEDGDLGAAALDVFTNEPDIGPDLLAAPRLLLSPHLGSATHDARKAMLDHVVRNVSAFLGGAELDGEIA